MCRIYKKCTVLNEASELLLHFGLNKKNFVKILKAEHLFIGKKTHFSEVNITAVYLKNV